MGDVSTDERILPINVTDVGTLRREEIALVHHEEIEECKKEAILLITLLQRSNLRKNERHQLDSIFLTRRKG